MKYKVLDTYGVAAKNAEFKKTVQKHSFQNPIGDLTSNTNRWILAK